MRGRGRVAAAARSRCATGSSRSGRARRAPRGRRLRVGDLRGGGGRVAARAPAARRRSSSPTRPTSARGATGSSAGRSRSSSGARSRPVRLLQALRNAALRRARHDRRAERVPRRDRGRLGARPSRDPRAHEPGAAAARGRRRAAAAGDVRLRRPADAAKALGTAIEAIAQVPEARLVVVGDGPERASSSAHAAASGAADRIEFRGSLLARRRAARSSPAREARLLSSAWENLPHSAVEALSVGVPVVATAVGGVPEVVHDGENGLLVPPGRPDELAAALRRVLDGGRAARAAGRRGEAVGRGDLERGDLRPARGAARGGARDDAAARPLRRPGALQPAARRLAGEEVGRGRASSSTTACWGAASAGSAPIRRALPARTARPAAPRSTRSLFYLRLPFRVRARSATFGPDAIIASDPVRRRRGARGPEARGPPHARDRRGARRLADVHALYGSRARRLVDRLGRPGRRRGPCGAPTRRARSRRSPRDLVEEVRGEPPTAMFTAYSDLSAFTERPVAPLPEQPDGHLRRRARALQERRGTGERLARRWRPRFPRRGW